MVKQISYITDGPPLVQAIYQQALEDFGITQLLHRLSSVEGLKLEVEELESLVALLIEQLTTSLNTAQIADYLNAIRLSNFDVISDSITIELNFLHSSITLAEDFPSNSASACFQMGDKVRWKPLSDDTDWGIVIGCFYAYARHRRQWSWKSAIWLDKNSSSSAWVVADTAWEEDLELFARENEQ